MEKRPPANASVGAAWFSVWHRQKGEGVRGTAGNPRSLRGASPRGSALRAEPPRHRPPRPQSRRRGRPAGIKAGREGENLGEGEGSADPSGLSPGLGRAPQPLRGAGCEVRPPPGHRGAGEAPRALPSRCRLFPRIKTA